MVDARTDEQFMRMALREASKGVGHTSPNPAVGAVIVQGGKLIARGFHRCAGLPHAEIEALNQTRHARGATLYVTLEPCSTHSRTPPCVEAIIAAGIARVVIGAIDPNPAHAGRAVQLLKKAGIAVTAGVLGEACAALNRSFNKWIVTGLPFVIAKAGMSLDGRLARPPGEDRWITSPASRADAHRLRARVDAILIGAETLRADNPRLTVRGVRGARQPWRVVLTRSGNLPSGAHLFTDDHRDRTLVYKNKPLRTVLRDLGKRGVTNVLIEGGSKVIGEAFDRRLVDAVQFYIAPLIIGGARPAVTTRGKGSIRLKNACYKKIGSDIRVTGDMEYTKPLLRHSASVLETAYAAGLSGSGRLHNLFLNCEAVTPGTYKQCGKGIIIRYGIHATPFGDGLFALTDKGLCALRFVTEKSAAAEIGKLRSEWGGATFVADQELAGKTARQIFLPAKSGKATPIRLHLRGTNFQLKVWQALLSMPSGTLATYSEIAALIGRPRAARAVGTALGKNPVAFLIPCHRVIHNLGTLGNYRWGVERKQAILGWEAGGSRHSMRDA